jgi:small subunit ribosomal protein S11e
MADIQTEKAF